LSNFPNPIDKIKGKTGSGIWIHGKGRDPGPRETKGCVALGNKDLAQLTQQIQYGMPVIIANSLSWTDRLLDARAPSELVSKVTTWARAWENKDQKFFEFYDPEKFSRSGESFRTFKEHKQQLFTSQNWLHVRISDMRVVAGPDYWVTYFNQYYRTPSITTEGVKRLYWQQDEKGVMRIVGNEWENANLGMERRYVEESVHQVMPLLEAWRASWEHGDVNKYLTFYDPKASQGDRVGLNSIRDHKLKLWKEKRPHKVAIDDLHVALHPDGFKVSFVQGYQADGNFKDKGYKTILLQPRGDSWQIVKEEWSAM
jgi:murein L,D-transpeptidase YafK